MLVATAERRSPFQMQSLRNPFERVLPAVVQMRDRVTTGVRGVGDALSQRVHRAQAQDTSHIAQARSTIASAIPQPSLRGISRATDEAIPQPHSAKKAIIHGIAEATKNSAPAIAVGFGARYILGTTLGVQALAVAAGASAVSRGVREATFTIRKGAFGATTKLITKHEEASILQNFDGSERVAHTGLRAKQDQFAQTSVGRVANAMLHGGEKKIAEFAYGKHRHAKALRKAQYQEVSLLSDKELIKLREHAVMARITNGTACDVYATRQLAKSTYQTVNRELAKRGIDRRKAHELQLKLYRKDALVGMGINVVGQAGLAAVKAIPKTIATFFITDAFLKAIHVDTSARHSPLEGFENTRLGHFIENAIAPKSVASAEELNANVPNVTQATVAEVKTAAATPHGGSPHNWTQGLTGTRPAHGADSLPAVNVTHKIVNGREAIVQSEVLSTKELTPVAVPRPPSLAPVVVEVDDKNANAVARAVVSGKDHLVTTQKTVTEVVHEQIAGETSLTQDIADKRIFLEMKDMTDPKMWFRQTDTAGKMMNQVIMHNTDKMDPEDITKLQAYLQANPHASFRDMWLDNRDVFSDDLDKLTLGTDYHIALEHVVTQQEAQQVAIAEAKNARVELVDHGGGGKPPGLAKYVASTVAKHHADTTPPPVNRTPNEEYMAMRKALESGQTVRSVGATTGATTNTGRPTAEEYLAMTRHTTNVASAVPANTGNPAHVNTSVEEYKRLIAQTKQASANTGEAVNHSTFDQHPRMDNNVYMRMQSEATAKAAEAARRSQQMDSQEYMRKVAEINARNGGVANVNATPVTQWEAPQHTTSWLDPNKSYTATFSTTDSHFSLNKSLPAYDLSNSNSADFNSVTAYINSLGGYNIELHAGELRAYGVQAFEPIRDYLQGGANIPRLGPIQEAYRAQQLIYQYTYLDIALGGRKIGGALSAFHHVTIENEALVVPPTDLDGIIGGGPDITALIGCSRGHVQAIQMLLNAEKNAPTSLAQYFAVLRDPRAEGYSVENAISAIVDDQWYKNSAEYSEFIKLYGYLDPSELTDAKYVELEANGYFTAGRLVFDLINSGGQ